MMSMIRLQLEAAVAVARADAAEFGFALPRARFVHFPGVEDIALRPPANIDREGFERELVRGTERLRAAIFERSKQTDGMPTATDAMAVLTAMGPVPAVGTEGHAIAGGTPVDFAAVVEIFALAPHRRLLFAAMRLGESHGQGTLGPLEILDAASESDSDNPAGAA